MASGTEKILKVVCEVKYAARMSSTSFRWVDAPIRSTPYVANGVLYVATEYTYYEFGKK